MVVGYTRGPCVESVRWMTGSDDGYHSPSSAFILGVEYSEPLAEYESAVS